MTDTLYQHLDSNIKFSWNFNDIIEKLGEDVYYGTTIPIDMYDSQALSYFQTFFSKVSTSTNFANYFITECDEICSKIIDLQSKTKERLANGELAPSVLTDLFMQKSLLPKDVLFLRMDCSAGADPHIDIRRKYALNIGFQNSNTCTTYIKEGTNVENFYEDFSKLKAITLNDGDAYLMNVGNSHAVKSNFPELSGSKRYIISINLWRQ